MKYLHRLFAFDDRPTSQQLSHQYQSSATLTSTLYSIIFIPESTAAAANQSQAAAARRVAREQEEQIRSPDSQSESSRELNWRRSHRARRRKREDQVVGGGGEKEESRETTTECGSSLGNFLLTATIGKTTASTSTLLPNDQTVGDSKLVEEFDSDRSDSDWILIDVTANHQILEANKQTHHHHHNQIDTRRVDIDYTREEVYFDYQEQKEEEEEEEEEDYENIVTQSQHQMALDANDVELIKASWIPVRKNPNESGLLLFKGLFTKFPQYLRFFPQFSDLDVEHMQENKRLLKHAVKVVETVTFVVDSIGDESKTTLLQSALVSLVRGHLKRKIGLSEFRNLGIVLIDFICDVNNRRHLFISSLNQPTTFNRHLLNKSISDSSQSNDSETMTSALDKIRASTSPSSSPEEESYLVANSNHNLVTGVEASLNERKDNHDAIHEQLEDDSSNKLSSQKKNEAKIDTSVLVAAWTKLYSGILDLVKHEEENQADEQQQQQQKST